MKRTYYRVDEVADMLHVTPESVSSYVRAGKIYCDRTPSGQRVFTQEHIDAYLGNYPHTIIITRGLPASGKSTFAHNWVAEPPHNRVEINRDNTRAHSSAHQNSE